MCFLGYLGFGLGMEGVHVDEVTGPLVCSSFEMQS